VFWGVFLIVFLFVLFGCLVLLFCTLSLNQAIIASYDLTGFFFSFDNLRQCENERKEGL